MVEKNFGKSARSRNNLKGKYLDKYWTLEKPIAGGQQYQRLSRSS